MKKVNLVVVVAVLLLYICTKTSFATIASFQGLGGLPSDSTPHSVSGAFDVSADGSVVVGVAYIVSSMRTHSEAFRWTLEDGMTSLGFLPNSNPP